MVEKISLISRQHRTQALERAGLNPFLLKASDVFIDLLTDSGTGAMSDAQWASMLVGDESYAGSRSFYLLADTVQDIFGYDNTIPVHQGRGAEQILFPALVEQAVSRGATKPKFISNHHFDTTKAHVELAGAEAYNTICSEALRTSAHYDWKGNFDLDQLSYEIEYGGAHQIAGVIITITCNSVGGQPASMSNIKKAAAIARHHGIPVIIDAARFAENAYFIKTRDPAYADVSLKQIIREMFSSGDIFIMSAKKDAMVNVGGLCCFREAGSLFQRVQQSCVAMEGFITYGGLAGRDMAAISVGLHEACDEAHQHARIAQVNFLGNTLRDAGIPIQTPVGGHAVFVDAERILPAIPKHYFPAQMLCNALYLDSGIRATEIGSLMMGRNPVNLEQEPSLFELMRLTIPRRTYTDNHMEYIAQSVIGIVSNADSLRPLTFTYEPPVLRQFTARFCEL